MSFRISDLEFVPLCGDHVNTNTGDEWDTLPFLVLHKGGAGSFFSMVDCTLTPAHLDLVRVRVPRPGLCGWTNNTLDRSHMAHYLPERADATEPFTERMRAGNALISERWGSAAALLMCAGGFSFQGARAWLNQRFFCVDAERVCQTMGAQFPSQRFFATRPGQTFHMENNLLKAVDEETPFLCTAPQEAWPLRQKGPLRELPDYEPATGRRELEKKDMSRLRHKLTEFAEALVGSVLFKSLYSLIGVEATGRISTFAFVLRNGAKQPPLVFEYNPTACTFEPGRPENPQAVYMAGMECWATDLLAVLSGELGPIAISYGRAMLWNVMSPHFNFNIFGELYRISHPLRRPAEFLRVYEKQWRKSAAIKPTILPR
jgi:hypothetical protein